MTDLVQQMSSLVMQSRKAIAVMGAPLSVIILAEGNSEIQSCSLWCDVAIWYCYGNICLLTGR